MALSVSAYITVDEGAHVDIDHCGCGDVRCTVVAEKFNAVIGHFETLAKNLGVTFELSDDLVEE